MNHISPRPQLGDSSNRKRGFSSAKERRAFYQQLEADNVFKAYLPNRIRVESSVVVMRNWSWKPPRKTRRTAA